jgi:hypothetical protein
MAPLFHSDGEVVNVSLGAAEVRFRDEVENLHRTMITNSEKGQVVANSILLLYNEYEVIVSQERR